MQKLNEHGLCLIRCHDATLDSHPIIAIIASKLTLAIIQFYIMEFQQAYQFPSDTIANRFLNDLRSGTIKGVSAKFHRDSATVKVTYTPLDTSALNKPENDGFDPRLAELDELAAHYEGYETSC